MADYYTQMSFHIESFPEELDRFLEMFNKLEEERLESDEGSLGISATKTKTLTKQADDCIWIHDEDGYVDIDALVDLIQEWMHTSEYNLNPVGFEWASTCSKPRLDAFGGGAVMVAKNCAKWLHTGQWLGSTIETELDFPTPD
jgi:hypothetical protein